MGVSRYTFVYIHFLLKGGILHEDDSILDSCAEGIDATLRSSEVHLVLTFFLLVSLAGI